MLLTSLIEFVVETEKVGNSESREWGKAEVQIDPQTMMIKEISNITIKFSLREDMLASRNLSKAKVAFDKAFMVWLSPKVAIVETGTGKELLFAEILDDNSVEFSLSDIPERPDGLVVFTFVNIVNPKLVTPIPGLEVLISAPSGEKSYFRSNDLKFNNKLGKLVVSNPHSEFIPGFFTSPFTIESDMQVAYRLNIKIITDSEYIESVPDVLEFDRQRLVFQENSFRDLETKWPMFRLKINKNTPVGKYSIRFILTEDNPVENFLKIERLYFSVGFPESSYSAQKPRPFNGPKPEIKFNTKNYFASLGGVSALKFILMEPAPTENFAIEIKTILPNQQDLISFHPNPMIMTAKGYAPFYIKPSVGSVSGNLHLHISDLFYKSNIIMKEKKANIDITYHDIESENIHVFVDERPAHNFKWNPLSQESVEGAVSKGANLNRSVEKEIQVVINHQVMVIFLFSQNENLLVNDTLLHKRLLDLSPLDNSTIVDMGNHMAAFICYPEYSDDYRGYHSRLEVDRSEFLRFLDYKIFLILRDGSLDIQLMDSFFIKSVRSDLKIHKLSLSSSRVFSKKNIHNYLVSFSNLKDNIIDSSSTEMDVQTSLQEESMVVVSDAEGGQEEEQNAVYSFLIYSQMSKDKIYRILEQNMISEKAFWMLKYYIYKERGINLQRNQWIRVEAIEEIDLAETSLNITIEDVAETMIHYSVSIESKKLGDIHSQMDFVALVNLREKIYSQHETDPIVGLDGSKSSESPNNTNGEGVRKSMIIFNKATGNAEIKFQGLKVDQEYYLQAQPCTFYRNTVLCDSKLVIWYHSAIFSDSGNSDCNINRNKHITHAGTSYKVVASYYPNRNQLLTNNYVFSSWKKNILTLEPLMLHRFYFLL